MLRNFASAMLALAIGVAQAGDWTRFRGPNGSATGPAISLPDKWSDDAIAFRVELGGDGDSSPVVFGDRLFVTVGKEKGKKREVVCLDANTGIDRWRRSIDFASHKIHAKNSYASPTPATDGKFLYATFADEVNQRAFCLDFDGNVVWERKLGAFVSQHGSGASPIVVDDMLIVPNEQDGESSVVALDRRTGDIRWTFPRKSKWASYATPLLFESGSSRQLIVMSTVGLTALDPASGKLIWTCEPFTRRTVSSPILASGLIIGGSGERGRGDLTLAVRPDGQGDVTKTHVAWRKTQMIPYCPTPLAANDNIFAAIDNGIVVCFDAKTAKEHWRHRLDEVFTASPVRAGDRLFLVSEDGAIYVVGVNPQRFELRGKNSVDDGFLASPALANDSLYLRGKKALWRLTAGRTAKQ